MPAGHVTVTATFIEETVEPEPEVYTVTVEESRNGKVTASPTKAIEDEKVTITVKPDDGYVLDELLVTDEYGDEVEPTKVSKTRYTFRMPAGDVTVEATFVKEEGEYDIRVQRSTHGKVTVSPSQADKGDKVTITVKPDDGYVLDELVVTDEDGDEVKLTKVSSTRYTFRMPAGDVKVKATFVKESLQDEDDEVGTTPVVLPFVDVFPSDYFYSAVVWAVQNGVTSGTTATTFSPNAFCTRAQTVTFLWRAAGCPVPVTKTNPFTDVKQQDYFYYAVLWAVENGITTGTSATTFSPEESCTRAQVATFLWRHSKENATQQYSFTDVERRDYFFEAVQWAAQRGVTTGTTATTFSPDDGCTRAQIVTFLYRYMSK